MYKQVKIFLLATIVFYGCQNKMQENTLAPDNDSSSSNLRMPFSQDVFLINNKSGKASLYNVGYDFQGLEGEATLTYLTTFDGHSHMTVHQSSKSIVVVNNGGRKKSNGLIYFYKKGDQKAFASGILRKKNGKKVSITQVDFDRKDRLFIAGGFYQVVPKNNPSQPLMEYVLNNQHDELEFTVVKYLKVNDDFKIDSEDEDPLTIEVESDVDVDNISNQYFEATTSLKGKVRFKGGDITFTQNSEETGGFEEEHLISFTRAHGHKKSGAAVKVTLANVDGKAVVKGEKLFNLKPRVTGAALMGDNHVIVSNAGSKAFTIYSLDGNIISEPSIVFSEDTPSDKVFNLTSAGDMACVQFFDQANDYGNVLERIYLGDREAEWLNQPWNLAEMKLYRPGYFNSDYDPSDNPEPTISTHARKNSANADIADLRSRAMKFTALGQNGMAIMKFRTPVDITSTTTLQLVETTWGSDATYNKDVEAANAKYDENATVHIWVPNNGVQPKYVSDDLVNGVNGEWLEVGHAVISENLYDLGTLFPELIGSSIQWVKVVDNGSTTPDGFDINYISAFSAE